VKQQLHVIDGEIQQRTTALTPFEWTYQTQALLIEQDQEIRTFDQQTTHSDNGMVEKPDAELSVLIMPFRSI
jgi:hypothetical protein